MKKDELLEKVNSLKWFHKIELPTDEGEIIVTPGIVDHCTEEVATKRYGLPENLNGQSVVDIGANNGYFSFLAKKRGAEEVIAIEPNQGDGDNLKCLSLAMKAIKYGPVVFEQDFISAITSYPLCHNNNLPKFDISLYFGVLYHIDNPIEHLSYLYKITRSYALIETAIAQHNYGEKAVWEFNPGFEGDPTNKWYPSIIGLAQALIHVGFSNIEVIYNDGIRATVKAYK